LAHRLYRLIVGSRLAACAVVLCAASVARAQDASTGVVEGVVEIDAGRPLDRVIVTVSDRSGVVAQDQTEFDGRYRISGLRPGTYRIGFSVGRTELVHGEVVIRADTVTVLPVRGPAAPVPRAIDPTSTTLTTWLDRDLLDHGVRTGFDLEAMFGVAPTAQGDELGVGFGGADSLENRYVVDGVDVTGVVYPTLGSGVPLDLVDGIEVFTAGARAAYGGFTGGFIRAVTRRGGNETRGSVFATFAPGALVADRETSPSSGVSIEAHTDVDLAMVAGAEVGGPIVRDHAWYWLGVAPRWTSSTLTRITRRRADCRETLGSGELSIAADQPCSAQPERAWVRDDVADVDPETGFEIYEELDRAAYGVGTRGLTIAGKLDAAVSRRHQGGVSVMVTPTFEDAVRAQGNVAEQRVATRAIATDVAATWSSRFDQASLDGVIGVHRSSYRLRSAAGRDDVPLQTLSFGDLGEWSGLGGESAATRAGCFDDTADDPYPGVVNCPMGSYAIGGPGALVDDAEQRIASQTTYTRHSTMLGVSTLQIGLGFEDARSWTSNLLSGGREISNDGAIVGRESITLTRPVEIREVGAPGTVACMGDAELVGCDPIVAGDAAARTGHRAFAWSTYFEEVWRPLSTVTFELGVRRDKQHLAGVLDVPAVWSPRFGVALDPTKEGRSRIYAHWGSYAERLPLSLSERLVGSAVEVRRYTADQCGGPVAGFGGPDGAACDPDAPSVVGDVSVGEVPEVDPALAGQQLEEAVFGFDREVRPGVTFGVAYVQREIVTVVEDVADDDDDGGLIIANPGWDLAEGLELARRDHRELQVRLTARVSRRMRIDASYVLSDTDGNYPGLWSPNNGQIEPNLSSQYDVLDTLANRDGALPHERPHYLKVDGYYTLGPVTVGGRLRALSGTPIDALASHERYGTGEVFLLPRGAMGRTPFVASVDLHADYARDLGDGVRLTVFVDLLNATNSQAAADVDDRFTYSNVGPIVGGAYEDLVFAKQDGSSNPVSRNPNFRRTTGRYPPLNARFGVRLTF